MKYIGNKTRLLPFIEESMKDFGIPFDGTFIDIFAGTASVGNHFKQNGFKIISNDFMTYSYVTQYAQIKLNKIPKYDFGEFKNINDVYRYLLTLEPKKGYFYENFAPSGKFKRKYFSNENAMIIDTIRDKIETWYRDKTITSDQYFYLLAVFIDSVDRVANISGTYGAFLKIWRSMALKDFEFMPIEVFNNSKENIIYQQDSNKLIYNIKGDVLYIDPPYNQRQYASNFHILETIAVWDKQELRGKSGLRDWSDQKSLYSSKVHALNALTELIENANVKYIVLSYNNEGIIPKEDIVNLMKSKGEYKEYIQNYRRFRTDSNSDKRQYKVKDDKVYEHLHICKVKL